MEKKRVNINAGMVTKIYCRRQKAQRDTCLAETRPTIDQVTMRRHLTDCRRSKK